MKRARAESRPVLVEVWAVWCPTCRALHRQVLANPEVAGFVRENFVFAMVDFDAPGTDVFMEEHGGRGTPSLWIWNPANEEYLPLPLSLEPEAFLARLRALATPWLQAA